MSTKIKNALISLSDKQELEKLLKILRKFDVNIISSGGTLKKLKNLDINVLKFRNLQNLKKC